MTMEPYIRLVALDMDGTLLDSQKRLPVDFKAWVSTHPDIKTVIASGRQYYTLRDDFADIQDNLIFIADNGGLVYAQDKIIYSNQMQFADIQAVLALVAKLPGVTPILCGAQSAYMRHAKDYIEAEGRMYYHHLAFTDDLEAAAQQDIIVKIALFIDAYAAEAVYKQLQLPNKEILTVLSGQSWIDIANRSVSKGAALAEIQRQYGISRADSMAFGDYLNDYTLLQACEESYCMGNGHPQLQAIAKHVTLTNDEDGVMMVLRRL